MNYIEEYTKWLASEALNESELAELKSIENDEKEIESRFFSQLTFGTAGLRGIMGVGLYRMNVHVIKHATAAFAEVICAQGEEAKKKGIAICYDCRHDSDLFAKEAAKVMATKGILVYLFEGMRPTPELSFAVRHYGCTAGINVTASHNPKEYNGYKVYWADGAQLPPDKAEEVATNMKALDIFSDVKTDEFDALLAENRIIMVGKELDNAFLGEVLKMQNYPQGMAGADDFTMVFTPFHGTGAEQIPFVIGKLGVKNLHCVPEQMIADGDFPTVKSPNPENPESFALAIKLAEDVGADFILGSDPDTDRVGVLTRDKSGAFKLLSGNQTGVLFLHYLLETKKNLGTLPSNGVALKTIVTTDLARKVAEDFGLQSYNTFTGFKFMAEKKNQLEESGEGHVIFSYEESFGYMLGDFVRDKDAVTAALLLTEMAIHYKSKNMTLLDAVDALFDRYGYHEELTINLVMPGLEGMANMAKLMENLRENPPKTIENTEVLSYIDYQAGILIDWKTATFSPTELVGSNVLEYHLADGTKLLVRPSGTEPKVKVYILAQGEDVNACHEFVLNLKNWAENTLVDF